MEFENMTNKAINTSLIKDIKAIIEESKKLVTRNVNTVMLQTYFGILGEELLKKSKMAMIKLVMGNT